MIEKSKNITKDKWKVINETDGIIASPKAMTKKEAEKFIKKFADRFKLQGYYLTGNNEKINPNDIKFSIVPFDQ